MSKIAKDKPALGRNSVATVVKKLLKEGVYVPARDIPIFYKILKQYPNARFWENYDLGFKLNYITWLLGADGQAKLKSDFAIFNLDIPASVPYTLEDSKVGEDLVTETNYKKPKNLADFLK